MSGIVPHTPGFPSTGARAAIVCTITSPVPTPGRGYLNLCKALPRGMPDKLEVSIIRYGHGVERSTAAYYGGRAYLIHITMAPGTD